jgi:cytochrome oxidase Cu insertion factor (SCO1/SenC/PrrC family)/thiol-disulfide isomerase/thioredoxin
VLRAVAAALLALILVGAAVAPAARADGDPGSDVLVYQDLFVGSDAGLSVQQQLQFSNLLKAANRAGFPIRVALIANPADLGAVTGLWRKPRAYARFLGIELSLAYKQRLLVVMPNGFGYNWPGHATRGTYHALDQIPVRPGGNGLLEAARTAVRRLASADGVSLGPAAQTSSAPAAPGSSSSPTSTRARATDSRWAIITAVLAAIVLACVLARRALGRRAAAGWRFAKQHWPRRASRAWALPSVAVLAVIAAGAVVIMASRQTPGSSPGRELAFNPNLDPGTPLSGPAPDFTLSDQFGRRVSLRSFRGKVVLLAFNDSECTTECPLTTTAMLQAKAMLGKAGSRVQLLGVDANPAAISLEDVWSYSELHGMQHAWHFLTGTLPELRRVWKRYAVEAAIERGQITHSPALFVIDPQGRRARVYITQMSYSAVGQLGELLAHEASNLLPDHPPVHSNLSYARIKPTTPSDAATLPRAGGGTVTLGPGKTARLYLFFATWDQETSGLAGQLDALNGYQATARRLGLPPLTAVDEASVEPSTATLEGFLRRLPRPLSYPVAIDRSGRVADGYEALGLPWFVLTSPAGQIVYYREVSTAGWPSRNTLVHYVRAALARAPSQGTNGAAATRSLRGSPPPLAALHGQASRLLGAQPALAARVRALRGYPIVINAWASWCGPCRSEFALFASASALYGRRVAFLGADTNDSAGDAAAFLGQHRVSYPSYQATTSNLKSLAVVQGLPTTIFINRAGKVVFVHTGQYDSQGTLDADIASYALGG